MNTQEATKNVIMVLNPDEKFRLQNFCGVTNSNLATPYDIQDLREDGFEIQELRENRIYSRHPYNKVYFELDDRSEDKIVLERINRISSIIALLGGKKMQVLSSSLELNDNTKSYEGSFKGQYQNVTGDISVSHSGQKKSYDGYDIAYEITWTPGVYNRKSYKEAVELARYYQLDSDSTIDEFLKQRNPNHPNKVSDKKYSVDVRSDLEEMWNTAIELEASVQQYNSDMRIVYTSKTRDKRERHNYFEFKVEFGELVPEGNTTIPISDEECIREKIEKKKKIIRTAIITTVMIAAGVLLATIF